jgi:hypothetical protein
MTVVLDMRAEWVESSRAVALVRRYAEALQP